MKCQIGRFDPPLQIAGAGGARVSLVAVLMLAAAAAAAAAGAQAQASDAWQTSGDIRSGYVSSESRARSGESSSADSFRVRARLRLRGELGGGWRFGGRIAARLDTEQDDEKFWLHAYAPGPSGLQDGQGTIDEAYLEYSPEGSPWSLRLGRFQAAFGLADVMKKSLDQNDSPNFDITWTDGAWLQRRGDNWNTHLIVRHNDRRGPSGTLRPPLDFVDGDSRASVFLAFESDATIGALMQRMVTVNWLPSALRPLGADSPGVEDYVAVTAKGTAQWPLGDGSRKFRLGAEVGYAPDTPRRETMRSGTGDADSLSWQVSANVIDIMPDHSFGIVYGRVADGWLLSSDFRPNDSVIEARWVWRVNQAWQLDARLRRREEIDLPAGTPHARRDDDLYVRATFRF